MTVLASTETLATDASPAEAATPSRVPASSLGPVWGLSVRDLHAAYWSARGVQPVERGLGLRVQRAADLYLLLEPGQLVRFDVRPFLESLVWDGVGALRFRILDPVSAPYREKVIVDDDGRVSSVQRRYRATVRGGARVLVTASRELAQAWAAAPTRRQGWQAARDAVNWRHVVTKRTSGTAATLGIESSERRFMKRLVAEWPDPGRSIIGLTHHGDGVWTTIDESPAEDAVLVGPLWLGSGSVAESGDIAIGPGWRADRHEPELPITVRRIREIDPAAEGATASATDSDGDTRGQEFAKRLFDIVFAVCVLVFCLPVFALVALAILIEDGRPLFYAQTRERKGGVDFKCWKFRSMYNDSERREAEFEATNLSDGPHVNIKDDPRVTRIGRLIRKLQVDELPQFWNVLRGEMSVVGPRPSPERENQYCPAWRELRLSVPPGITGLWQVRRTRAEGQDFQEWIRYDIEYVQTRSFWLDLKICLLTARMVLTGRRTVADDA